jgi:hypothetical protein
MFFILGKLFLRKRFLANRPGWEVRSSSFSLSLQVEAETPPAKAQGFPRKRRIDCSLQVAGDSLISAYRLPATHHSSLITHYHSSLIITHHLLLPTHPFLPDHHAGPAAGDQRAL